VTVLCQLDEFIISSHNLLDQSDIYMFVLQHGSESKVPLKYSHIDIAASSGDLPDDATGAPILGLVGLYLKDRY
jgi:hypothetical protein